MNKTIKEEELQKSPSSSIISAKSEFFSKTKKWLFLAITGIVEIVALLLMTSVLNSFLIYQNMAQENICIVRTNLSAEICKELLFEGNEALSKETYEKEYTAVQTIFVDTKFYRSIVDHTFPILFVIFAGPWSDHFGRKLPLLLPVLGFTIQHVVYLIASFYIDTIDPYWLAVLASLPRSLTGGETAYAMAAYSYIADITLHSSRTVRHGILNAAYVLGVPCGFSLGGRLIRGRVAYATCFGISVALSTLGLGILIFFAKNVTKAERLTEADEDEGGGEDVKNTGNSSNLSLVQILNPKNNLVKVAALPFQKRVAGGRAKLLMLLVAFVCSAAPIHGEFGVILVFAQERLKWVTVDYGDFSTFNTLIGVVGVILSMGILSKWAKLSDPVVGFIAGISQMSGSLLYAFATTGLMMYIASAVDSMNGTMIVIARSMMSKIVSSSEIGTLFSLVAILETLTPLAMDPTYNRLFYLNLVNCHWLGWFFILSAVLTIPPQCVYLWFIIKQYFSPGPNPSKDSRGQDGTLSPPVNGLPSSHLTSSSPAAVQKRDSTTDEDVESSMLNVGGVVGVSDRDGGHTNLAFSSDESINHAGVGVGSNR